MKTSIPYENWLAELAKFASAADDEGGALTVREIVEKMKLRDGRSAVDRVREMLRRGIADGSIEATMAKRASLDGRVFAVPAYRPVQKAKGAK